MKTKMKSVSRDKLVELIKATDGKIFRVTFIKRTTNEYRDMTARFGVTSALKGGKLKFNPKEKNLLIVYDMDVEDYRAINISGLVSAHIDDTEYVVKEVISTLIKKRRKI